MAPKSGPLDVPISEAKMQKLKDDKKARKEYKLQKTRDLLSKNKNMTAAEFSDRRSNWWCMRDHPGRYCRDCNPKRELVCTECGNDDGTCEHVELMSEDSAPELSELESWGEGSEKNGYEEEVEVEEDDGDEMWIDSEDELSPSPTYSFLWTVAEDEIEATKWANEQIALVDAAAATFKDFLQRYPRGNAGRHLGIDPSRALPQDNAAFW